MDSRRGAEHVYEALVDAGVDLLVGLPGTQTLPLDSVVAERSEVDYVMARHETAVPHVAWGYYEAGGGPAATLTVPGPGETNAMHGLNNALEDNVPVVHVTGDMDPEERGRGPIHEIAGDTYDNVVKANVSVAERSGLRPAVERGIAAALTPPYGPVRLGVPSSFLSGAVQSPEASVTPEQVTYETDGAVADAAALLADAERPAVYVGGGTRRAPGGPVAVRDLVATLDAPVVVSYKGKGVVPDDTPQVMGTGAGHLPAGARQALERADVVLALGADLDGVSTDHWTLPLGDALVHNTLDPDDLNAGYDADLPLLGDAATVADGLRRELADRSLSGWSGERVAGAVRAEWFDHLDGEGLLDDAAPAATPAVLRAVRDALDREAVVTTDVGGHRLWAKQVFDAYGPERYVTAGSWAGMGVGLPAALGAKLARPDRPVVSLHGDGGLMMCLQELHTAAEEGIPVVVVVFADADYGIISKSPEIREHGGGRRFAWSSPDFAAVAEGFGCRGVHAETPSGAADAVADAVGREVPTLVQVAIREDEPSVFEAADYESELSF